MCGILHAMSTPCSGVWHDLWCGMVWGVGFDGVFVRHGTEHGMARILRSMACKLRLPEWTVPWCGECGNTAVHSILPSMACCRV